MSHSKRDAPASIRLREQEIERDRLLTRVATSLVRAELLLDRLHEALQEADSPYQPDTWDGGGNPDTSEG